MSTLLVNLKKRDDPIPANQWIDLGITVPDSDSVQILVNGVDADEGDGLQFDASRTRTFYFFQRWWILPLDNAVARFRTSLKQLVAPPPPGSTSA